MRVLIVDNDARRGGALAAELKAFGHECDVEPPDRALTRLTSQPYAIAISDYMDGGRDFLLGYKQHDPLLPVIVATHAPSWRTATEFLAGGALSAAVDYIVLPDADLGQRIAASIELHYGRVSVGDFVAERASGRATYRGTAIELTPLEFGLLLLFMRRAYGDVSYEEMALFLYNEPLDRETAFFRLKSTIHRLRRTLRKLTGRQDVLRRRKVGTLRFSPESRPPVGLS